MTSRGKPLASGSSRKRGSSTILHAVDPDAKIEIPRLPPGLDLTPAAKRRWREIWSDPIASQYAKVDQPSVERLVRLYSLADVETAVRTLVEISRECRALEQALGCSPRARSQMKVEYGKGEDAERRSRRRRNAEVVTETSIAPVREQLTKDEMLERLRAGRA